MPSLANNRAYANRFSNIYLFVTERCQLRCGHCYMGERLERGNYFEVQHAIDALQYWHRMGGRFLTLVGGEPTLHPHLGQIVAAALDVGYEKVMLDTNALLPERIYVIPPSALYYVRVSLDGATSSTHDKVRGHGNFERVIAGIGQLITHGYTVRITSTLFKFNRHEVADLVRLSESLGIRVLNFHSFTPEGCGAQNSDWAMSPSEWHVLWQDLERTLPKSSVEVRFPPSWIKEADIQRYVDQGFQGCLGCSLDRLSVFPDGRCYACSLLFDHDCHIGTFSEEGFRLNTASSQNEFELFTKAAAAVKSGHLMGCPAEKKLGLHSDGLLSVCRLWRTTIASNS